MSSSSTTVLPARWDLSSLLTETFKYLRVLIAFVLSLHQGLLLNLLGNSALWAMCIWQTVKGSFTFWFLLSCIHMSHKKPQSWRRGVGVVVMRMRGRAYRAKAEFGPFEIILPILSSHSLTSILNMLLFGCKLRSIYTTLRMETTRRMWVKEMRDQTAPSPIVLSPGQSLV